MSESPGCDLGERGEELGGRAGPISEAGGQREQDGAQG
jgi:hypothetical protein